MLKKVSLKAQKRLLESWEKWRKSRLHIDGDIFKNTLRNHNRSLKQARKEFFLTLIDTHKNNPKHLFLSIDKLISPSSAIASDTFSIAKCNEFASFFNNKILIIRRNIPITDLTANYDIPPPLCANTLKHRSTVDSNDLTHAINLLKFYTSPHDPLTASFF